MMKAKFLQLKVAAWNTHTGARSPDLSTPMRIELPEGISIQTFVLRQRVAYGIGANGAVYIWGSHSLSGEQMTTFFSLDLKFLKGDPREFFPLKAQRVSTLSCNSMVALFVTCEGTVYSYGNDLIHKFGILAQGDIYNLNSPMPVRGLMGNKIKQVSVGYSHACACSVMGTLFSWGEGRRGQLGLKGLNRSREPLQIQNIVKIKQVIASTAATLFLSEEGFTYISGTLLPHISDTIHSSEKQGDIFSEPRKIESLSKNVVVKIASGEQSFACLTKEGDVIWVSADLTSYKMGTKHSIKDLQCVEGKIFGITEEGKHLYEWTPAIDQRKTGDLYIISTCNYKTHIYEIDNHNIKFIGFCDVTAGNMAAIYFSTHSKGEATLLKPDIVERTTRALPGGLESPVSNLALYQKYQRKLATNSVEPLGGRSYDENFQKEHDKKKSLLSNDNKDEFMIRKGAIKEYLRSKRCPNTAVHTSHPSLGKLSIRLTEYPMDEECSNKSKREIGFQQDFSKKNSLLSSKEGDPETYTRPRLNQLERTFKQKLQILKESQDKSVQDLQEEIKQKIPKEIYNPSKYDNSQSNTLLDQDPRAQNNWQLNNPLKGGKQEENLFVKNQHELRGFSIKPLIPTREDEVLKKQENMEGIKDIENITKERSNSNLQDLNLLEAKRKRIVDGTFRLAHIILQANLRNGLRNFRNLTSKKIDIEKLSDIIQNITQKEALAEKTRHGQPEKTIEKLSSNLQKKLIKTNLEQITSYQRTSLPGIKKLADLLKKKVQKHLSDFSQTAIMHSAREELERVKYQYKNEKERQSADLLQKDSTIQELKSNIQTLSKYKATVKQVAVRLFLNILANFVNRVMKNNVEKIQHECRIILENRGRKEDLILNEIHAIPGVDIPYTELKMTDSQIPGDSHIEKPNIEQNISETRTIIFDPVPRNGKKSGIIPQDLIETHNEKLDSKPLHIDSESSKDTPFKTVFDKSNNPTGVSEIKEVSKSSVLNKEPIQRIENVESLMPEEPALHHEFSSHHRKNYDPSLKSDKFSRENSYNEEQAVSEIGKKLDVSNMNNPTSVESSVKKSPANHFEEAKNTPAFLSDPVGKRTAATSHENITHYPSHLYPHTNNSNFLDSIPEPQSKGEISLTNIPDNLEDFEKSLNIFDPNKIIENPHPQREERNEEEKKSTEIKIENTILPSPEQDKETSELNPDEYILTEEGKLEFSGRANTQSEMESPFNTFESKEEPHNENKTPVLDSEATPLSREHELFQKNIISSSEEIDSEKEEYNHSSDSNKSKSFVDDSDKEEIIQPILSSEETKKDSASKAIADPCLQKESTDNHSLPMNTPNVKSSVVFQGSRGTNKEKTLELSKLILKGIERKDLDIKPNSINKEFLLLSKPESEAPTVQYEKLKDEEKDVNFPRNSPFHSNEDEKIKEFSFPSEKDLFTENTPKKIDQTISNEELLHEELSHEERLNEEQSHEEQANEEQLNEELLHDKNSHEEQPNKEILHEGLSHEVLSHEGLSHEEQSHEEQQNEELLNEKLLHDKKSLEERPIKKQDNEELLHEELSHKEQSHEELTHERKLHVKESPEEKSHQELSNLDLSLKRENQTKEKNNSKQIIHEEKELICEHYPSKKPVEDQFQAQSLDALLSEGKRDNPNEQNEKPKESEVSISKEIISKQLLIPESKNFDMSEKQIYDPLISPPQTPFIVSPSGVTLNSPEVSQQNAEVEFENHERIPELSLLQEQATPVLKTNKDCSSNLHKEQSNAYPSLTTQPCLEYSDPSKDVIKPLPSPKQSKESQFENPSFPHIIPKQDSSIFNNESQLEEDLNNSGNFSKSKSERLASQNEEKKSTLEKSHFIPDFETSSFSKISSPDLPEGKPVVKSKKAVLESNTDLESNFIMSNLSPEKKLEEGIKHLDTPVQYKDAREQIKLPATEEEKVKSSKIEEAEVGSPTIEESEVKSLRIEESEVKSHTKEETRIKSLTKEQAEIKSSKIEESEVISSNIEEAEVGSPTIEKSEVKSLKIEGSEVKSLRIEESEVKSHTKEEKRIKSLTKEQAEIKPSKIGESEIKSLRIEESEVKSHTKEETTIKSPTEEGAAITSPTIEETTNKSHTKEKTRINLLTIEEAKYINDPEAQTNYQNESRIKKAEPIPINKITNKESHNKIINPEDISNNQNKKTQFEILAKHELGKIAIIFKIFQKRVLRSALQQIRYYSDTLRNKRILTRGYIVGAKMLIRCCKCLLCRHIDELKQYNENLNSLSEKTTQNFLQGIKKLQKVINNSEKKAKQRGFIKFLRYCHISKKNQQQLRISLNLLLRLIKSKLRIKFHKFSKQMKDQNREREIELKTRTNGSQILCKILTRKIIKTAFQIISKRKEKTKILVATLTPLITARFHKFLQLSNKHYLVRSKKIQAILKLTSLIKQHFTSPIFKALLKYSKGIQKQNETRRNYKAGLSTLKNIIRSKMLFQLGHLRGFLRTKCLLEEKQREIDTVVKICEEFKEVSEKQNKEILKKEEELRFVKRRECALKLHRILTQQIKKEFEKLKEIFKSLPPKILGKPSAESNSQHTERIKIIDSISLDPNLRLELNVETEKCSKIDKRASLIEDNQGKSDFLSSESRLKPGSMIDNSLKSKCPPDEKIENSIRFHKKQQNYKGTSHTLSNEEKFLEKTEDPAGYSQEEDKLPIAFSKKKFHKKLDCFITSKPHSARSDKNKLIETKNEIHKFGLNNAPSGVVNPSNLRHSKNNTPHSEVTSKERILEHLKKIRSVTPSNVNYTLHFPREYGSNSEERNNPASISDQCKGLETPRQPSQETRFQVVELLSSPETFPIEKSRLSGDDNSAMGMADPFELDSPSWSGRSSTWNQICGPSAESTPVNQQFESERKNQQMKHYFNFLDPEQQRNTCKTGRYNHQRFMSAFSNCFVKYHQLMLKEENEKVPISPFEEPENRKEKEVESGMFGLSPITSPKKSKGSGKKRKILSKEGTAEINNILITFHPEYKPPSVEKVVQDPENTQKDASKLFMNRVKRFKKNFGNKTFVRKNIKKVQENSDTILKEKMITSTLVPKKTTSMTHLGVKSSGDPSPSNSIMSKSNWASKQPSSDFMEINKQFIKEMSNINHEINSQYSCQALIPRFKVPKPELVFNFTRYKTNVLSHSTLGKPNSSVNSFERPSISEHDSQ